ncbi:hypothetical protein QF026_003942 [Streptomyces aurantiacus]|nr:hypothetical protein [Streptomyces aurantiacus]
MVVGNTNRLPAHSSPLAFPLLSLALPPLPSPHF